MVKLPPGLPPSELLDLMQGLSWWLYEADVVAHAVMEETGKKAVMALPKAFFSARSQRCLLAFANLRHLRVVGSRPHCVLSSLQHQE